MTKTYQANTPLILKDAAGKSYRVERGDTVALSDEQYADVAAHVTLLDTQPESANAPTPSHLAEEQPETPDATPAQPETPKPKTKGK